MTPFLDNAHVHKAHKFRVQFKGPHTFTITNQREKLATIALPPVYEFYNRDGMSRSCLSIKSWLMFRRLFEVPGITAQ